MTEAPTVAERSALYKQPTIADDHEDLSTHTIRAVTPNPDLLELSKNGHSKEATTPLVVAPLPVPPPSPKPSITTAPLPEPFPNPPSHFRGRPRSNRHLDRNRKFTKKNVGIVIGDFRGIFPDELTLDIGERIEIISKDTVVSRNIGWWTGRNEKGKIGIFPAACVKVVLNTTEASELTLEHEYPLEIPYNDLVLKEVVGVGGFGKVHRAVYKGEDVAVKVAKNTTFDNLKAVQEVISEAEKFASLAHQNVCALVGVVLVKDISLVMEYARGGALSEVLHKKNISLPVDVILDWATQISSGMTYLHHEAQPSLIHRDLKSSNILLAQKLDASTLYTNTIKITDFGLAREIEHTTHMSGAGTYPWMAPEVIRSSDFSKKSDVWSYAVVLWELLTGEKPYSGLNLFVVAYGVGHGTLCLPIPEGCPEQLEKLMKACWARVHSERPTFSEILTQLQEMESDEFFSSTSHREFRSIQNCWREEIQKRFTELKSIEAELQAREHDLQKRMKVQDKHLREKQEALEKREDDLLKQAEVLEKKMRDLEDKRRPPRLKRFSLRKLIRWLSGPAGEEEKRPLPSQFKPEGRFAVTATSDLQPRMRLNSSPGPSDPSSSLPTPDISHMRDVSPAGKRSSLPKEYFPSSHGGHHRQLSNDLPTGVSKQQLNIIDTTTAQFLRRRDSSPIPGDAYPQLVPTATSIERQRAMEMDLLRMRSMSDTRSTSPQMLQRHQMLSTSPALSSSMAFSQVSATATGFTAAAASAIKKPGQLSFRAKPKSFSSVDSSPSSPMMTVTSAEGHSIQYDSGKDSMTCSDASNSSETQLIKLDSPVGVTKKTFDFMAEFDPLKHSTDNDSLLFDPYGGKTSGNCSPNALSSSPQAQQQQQPPLQSIQKQGSPKQSHARLSIGTLDTPSPNPSPNIARPRPRPIGLQYHGVSDSSLPISAPSSRPHSPKTFSALFHHRGSDISPTGSVHSLVQYPTYYDSDTGIGCGFQSDSDATSTTSSLLDLTDFPDPNPTLIPIPTPAQLDVMFDLSNLPQ